MPEGHVLLLYLAALGAVYLAPGPDMALLLATAAGRGTRAGLRTALGLAAARYCHCLAAGLGLAALFAAHPPLQSAVRAAGAAYLLWLAWKALRAGKRPRDDAKGRSTSFAPDSANIRPEWSTPPHLTDSPDLAGAATARADALRSPKPEWSDQPDAPIEPDDTTARGIGDPPAPPRNENATARRWEEKRPGGTTPAKGEMASRGSQDAKGLWPDFARGLLTNLLNPKALLFCGLFLPQFVSASRGALLPQFLLLGALLVAVGFAFDTVYALMAGGLPGLLRRRWAAKRTAGSDRPNPSNRPDPSNGAGRFDRARRWLMGSVFAALAARLVAG